MIPRWPAPPRRRTAQPTGRVVGAVTVIALAAVLAQAALTAHANTPPASPSGARLAAEPARHDLTRDTEADIKADTKAEAIWLDADTVAWNGVKSAASTQLLYARDGDLSDARTLRLRGAELTEAQKAKFPHLKNVRRLRRRPARPRPGPRGAARPARRHPARRRRRRAWRRPACRSPACSTTSTAHAPRRRSSARSSARRTPHASPSGRPPRRTSHWSSTADTVPMRRDDAHRRLVAYRRPKSGRQALPRTS